MSGELKRVGKVEISLFFNILLKAILKLYKGPLDIYFPSSSNSLK